MHWRFSRPVCAVFLSSLSLAGTLHAQTSPTLREAVQAAWELSPQARAQANKQAELDARGRAAGSLIAGPAALSLGHRTDRIGSDLGSRETEIEVSAPIWTPGVRRATADHVQADRAAFDGQQLLARARLAGEVREAAAQVALAQAELAVAQNKSREAQVLAADVSRRVRAGESAKVDLLQAQSIFQQASATELQARSALSRAQGQWRALTGLPTAAVLDEAEGSPGEHPSIVAAQAQLRAAQAKLSWTSADRRDPMEVGLGLVRERPVAGAPNERSMRLSLRVPLGSVGRNGPKEAVARAELDAAEAELQAAQRTVDAERNASRTELETARKAESLAAERESASREVQGLVAKSFQLGESDLPTRLRAEVERADAELALARARLEVRRALTKLNQAYGVIP